MPNQSGKVVLVLILLIFISVTSLLLIRFDGVKDFEKNDFVPSPSPISVKQNKALLTYTSEDFKMKLKIPEGLKVKDEFPVFMINDGGMSIEIVRNGTEYKELQDYIKSYNERRGVRETYRETGDIKEIPFVKRDLTDSFGETRRVYFIYVDSAVYLFSTADEELYPVLDQIFESFEYKS